MKIYINGRFLTQRFSGVQRYAWEMTKAIDLLINTYDAFEKNQYFIIAPTGCLFEPKLKNIQFICKGISKGHLWEQFELPIYTRDGFLINFCNCAPLLKRNQTVTIHDAAIVAMPNTFSTYFRIWYKLMFIILGKTLNCIFTVSNFSKNELHKYFGITLSKISVTYNGIDHLENIIPNEDIINRINPKGKRYILAVSSLNPSKNFKLILKIAKKMPDVLFIIAGGTNPKVFNAIDIEKSANVKFIGYVTDEELLALYKHASVFLYPSLYEGFGIPPLEALSCDCPVIVSDIEVFHEIYGNSVNYCEPKLEDVWRYSIYNIINNKTTVDKIKINDRYNWNIQARVYIQKLNDILNI